MTNLSQEGVYRVRHHVWDLGWVDFDFFFPPSCSLAQPILPISHQPKQNQAAGGTNKKEVNPTHYPTRWTTLYISHALQFVESGFGDRLVTFSVGEGRGRRLVIGWKADFDRR